MLLGERLTGFQKTIFSWRLGLLSTLQQSVTVIQTFALSKVWYVAQVLPLPSSVAKKMDSLISAFIFQGRHERLKLTELQNPPSKGGLGLTCVSTKAECLLLRQSLRILARPQHTCNQHLAGLLPPRRFSRPNGERSGVPGSATQVSSSSCNAGSPPRRSYKVGVHS